MSWPGQAAQHDADHGEAEEGGSGAGVALEVARQATIAAGPCQRSLDDPSLGQDDERVQFVALDDLDDPTPGTGGGFCHARPLVAGIGEDAFDEGEEAARAVIEHQPRAVAVLNVGGMHDDVQEQAERIDEDVPLAARNLLARIKALRVECRAPF
jgi:hypothetical protein